VRKPSDEGAPLQIHAPRAISGAPAPIPTLEQSLCAHNADFQDEYGYERDEPGGGDLRTAGNWVGERFDCLSYTLEMPFKDNANAPDEESGWSPERSMHLGASTLEAILDSLDYLRGEVPIASEGESQGESESESESESEGESESQGGEWGGEGERDEDEDA
jgi:hypothetical protein